MSQTWVPISAMSCIHIHIVMWSTFNNIYYRFFPQFKSWLACTNYSQIIIIIHSTLAKFWAFWCEKGSNWEKNIFSKCFLPCTHFSRSVRSCSSQWWDREWRRRVGVHSFVVWGAASCPALLIPDVHSWPGAYKYPSPGHEWRSVFVCVAERKRIKLVDGYTTSSSLHKMSPFWGKLLINGLILIRVS